MENTKKPLFFYYPSKNQIKEGNLKNQRRMTVAGIVTDGKLKVDIAECSLKDPFIRKKGRAIAIARALSNKPKRVFDAFEDKLLIKQFINIAKELLVSKGAIVESKQAVVVQLPAPTTQVAMV